MNVKQEYQHDGNKPDAIDLGEIEMVGGNAAESVIKASEHVSKPKVESNE